MIVDNEEMIKIRGTVKFLSNKKLTIAVEPEQREDFVLQNNECDYRVRYMDKQGTPRNWIYLDLYEAAKGKQERLSPGIRPCFKEGSKIEFNIIPCWTTLENAYIDDIKKCLELEGRDVTPNYSLKIQYSISIVTPEGPHNQFGEYRRSIYMTITGTGNILIEQV
ncbi:MAG: hypothetical protein PHY47_16905 [Lachnospiraceae bacterium]|nr:hypothetical protein [Lachnospiraceae bacterium]